MRTLERWGGMPGRNEKPRYIVVKAPFIIDKQEELSYVYSIKKRVSYHY
jgi:hypothetical protein